LKKFFAIFWMVFAVIINMFALAGLLYHFGLADRAWAGVFSGPDQTYMTGVETVFSPLDNILNSSIGSVAPFWLLHAITLVLATTLAVFIARRTFTIQVPRNLSKTVFGVIVATGLSYGLARVVNPAQDDVEMTKYENQQDEDFVKSLTRQCTHVFNRHGRSAQYMQRNFDRALQNEKWKKANRTAAAINELSACLSSDLPTLTEPRRRARLAPYSGDPKLNWVDIARVNLGLADNFYAAERWGQARDYYDDGFAALGNVIDEFLGPDIKASEPVTQQDTELSILFNSETIFAQRLNQLSAMARLAQADQSQDIDFAFMTPRILKLQNLRASYYIDSAENTLMDSDGDKPIASRLSNDGRTVVIDTIEKLIEIAQTLRNEKDQLLAVQNFNALLELYGEYDRMGTSTISVAGLSSDVRQYWRDLGDQINAKHQEHLGDGNTALAPFQFSMSKRLSEKLIAPEIWSWENGDEAPDAEFLRQGEEYAVRFVNVSGNFEPERLPEFLKKTPGNNDDETDGFDAQIDPFDTLPRILAMQERNEDALQALEARARYQLRLEPLTRMQIKAVVSDYLTFGLGTDPHAVKRDLTRESGPESLIIQQRWAKIAKMACADSPFKGRPNLSPSCPDYLLNLIFPNDTWHVVSGAPYLGATVPVTTIMSSMVMIDLLFGTTRAYDKDSPTAEMMFTKNDDPLARGWRGQAVLSAPEEYLGAPLLADAFNKGSDRAAYFKFIERPDIYGFDAAAHEAFNVELKTRLRNAKKNEVLIFIHGVGNTFNSAAKRTAQLAYDLSFPGQAMFYTWPTEDSFFGYFKDIDVPQMAIDDLAKFLGEAADTVQSSCDGIQDCAPGKVNIIAHSHGARVTKDALEKLTKDRAAAGQPLRLGQVIFAAPDVDGKKLRNAVDKNLSQISDRVTIYTNNSDKALLGSSLLRFFKWRGGLGKKGTCSARMIDASSAVPFGSHSYFAQESEVIADLRTSLWHGDIGPEQRCYLTKKKKKSFAGWKFDKNNCDITAYDLASQIAIQAQQTNEVDFDRLYTDLIGSKQIRDATNESNMQSVDPNNWTMLNVAGSSSEQPAPVRVLKPRYDKAKSVYAEFAKGSVKTTVGPCAP